MARFTAYITEYNSEGEPEDSYKEWFESDSKNPTKEEAASKLRVSASDIIQIIKQ